MLIQVIRGGIRVLLHDPSGFSMPGYLSRANRTRAFYTNSLSFFNVHFFIMSGRLCDYYLSQCLFISKNSTQFRTFRNSSSFSDV